NQPFRSPKDYDDFLKRLAVFPAWTDTAIANMREGIGKGWVLPRALVVKVLPQLEAMLVPAEQSTFYGAVKAIPDSFAGAEKARITAAYRVAIDSIVQPAYRRLYDFMSGEYLAKARAGSGIGDIPQGADYYRYLIRNWTTTTLSPDSIYRLGLSEVARIEAEMNRVKTKTGFAGDLPAFFSYVSSDPKFFPFKSVQQVIDSFWNIKKVE